MTEYLNNNGYSYEKSEEVRRKQKQKIIYVDHETRYIITDQELKKRIKEQVKRYEDFKKKQKDGDHNAKFNKLIKNK